jgi:hypothetical protein
MAVIPNNEYKSIYDIMNETKNLINMINWTVPFLLGLLSSFIIDFIRNRIKRRREKKFIKIYLTNIILSKIPELEKAYVSIRERINNFSNGHLKIPVFESFNSKVLNGIMPTEYYEVYREDYTILNEVITTIEFISENLPIEIDQSYYDYINSHLSEKNKTGDTEHEKTCPACINHRNLINGIIDLRIDELNKLKHKILKLTK